MRHRKNLDRLALFMVCRNSIMANENLNSEDASVKAIKKINQIRKGLDFNKCEEIYLKAKGGADDNGVR